MSTHTPTLHEDPDRTDELPVFDPVAYEAKLKAETGLSQTDAWRGPDTEELHVARISALEAELESRDSVLNALRDDLEHTTAAKARVATELGGILEQIHELQTRLAESETNSAALQERQRELAAEREELEHRTALLGAELDNTHNAHGAAEKRIVELTAEFNRAHAQALTEGTRASQLEREMIDAEERVRELRGKLDAQTTSAKEVARLFAAQYARSDELALALEANKSTLQQREAELQTITEELRTTGATLTQVRQQLLTAQKTGADSLSTKDSHIEALDTRLTEAQGRCAELETAHNAAKKLAEGLQKELEHARHEASVLQNHLGIARSSLNDKDAKVTELNTQIASVQATLNEKTVALTNTEQALARATRNTTELDAQLTVSKQDLEALRSSERDLSAKSTAQHTELESWRARAQVAEQNSAALQQELAASNARIAELMQSLETAQSHDTNIQHELKRTHEEVHALAHNLDARNSKIVALESQLSAHADALSAIRRDIARVSGKRTADSAAARKLVSADRKGRSFVLTSGTLRIGRTAENDIQIPSNLVSRHHARLLVGPNAVIIEDLDSTNGCYVNGHQVKKQVLQDGDVVLIGQERFRYVAPNETDAKEGGNEGVKS